MPGASKGSKASPVNPDKTRSYAMRKMTFRTGLAFLVLVGLALTLSGLPKAMTWTGWISDSGCAAKGTDASHKACALACVKEKEAKWVFVNSQTGQVFSIHNQESVQEKYLGMEVKVTGEQMEDGSIHVATVAAAK
jgi:hypothetical protein